MHTDQWSILDYGSVNKWKQGWGKHDEGPFPFTDLLQQVQLPIVTQSVCKIRLREYEFREETMICAEDVVNDGIDSCQVAILH